MVCTLPSRLGGIQKVKKEKVARSTAGSVETDVGHSYGSGLNEASLRALGMAVEIKREAFNAV